MKWALGATLFLLGCGTRFVDLTLPGDAGPSSGMSRAMSDAGTKCESVKRADGTDCKICYGPDGKLLDGVCPATTMMSTGMAAPVDPTTATCKVDPLMADIRCLQCVAPTGSYTACLKCEAPIKTGAGGEYCRTCLWSDLGDNRCLQCFTADNMVTHDDCDSFRKETLPKMVVIGK